MSDPVTRRVARHCRQRWSPSGTPPHPPLLRSDEAEVLRQGSGARLLGVPQAPAQGTESVGEGGILRKQTNCLRIVPGGSDRRRVSGRRLVRRVHPRCSSGSSRNTSSAAARSRTTSSSRGRSHEPAVAREPHPDAYRTEVPRSGVVGRRPLAAARRLPRIQGIGGDPDGAARRHSRRGPLHARIDSGTSPVSISAAARTSWRAG